MKFDKLKKLQSYVFFINPAHQERGNCNHLEVESKPMHAEGFILNPAGDAL
jgi:hypothetical protein